MAFHPYPQLIRAVFNPQRFGPPPGFTPASSWPWIDRVGFGSTPTYFVAHFRLAFAAAPDLKPLTSHVRSNSPDHNAKGTQSPVSGSEDPTRLLPLVRTRFQDLFHSPSGVLFTFPSRYSALSVTDSYLALEDGPPRFKRDFTCPALLGYLDGSILTFRIRDSHPLRWAVPGPFRYAFSNVIQGPTTPARRPVWALPVSLAATQGVSIDFLSCGYLDVSVLRVRPTYLWIQYVVTPIRVPGFPIRTFPDQRLFATSPRLFAGYNVLHRL